MAKKKINIKSVSTDVESGDVNISYKNVRIAGLSETTTAVLETKDTICEDDIEVEYTKPAGGDVTTPKTFSATIPDDFFEAIDETAMRGATVYIDDGDICQTTINSATHYIPENRRGGIQFVIDIKVGSDMYNVSINNENVPYANGEYWCEVLANSLSEMPNISLVITDKIPN